VRTETELCPRNNDIDEEADWDRTFAPSEAASWYGNQGIVRVCFTSGVTAWQRPSGQEGALPGLSPEAPLPFKTLELTVVCNQGPLDSLLWRRKRQWRRWFSG
jgi:hypothetical protein